MASAGSGDSGNAAPEAERPHPRPFLIGVSGGTASGKVSEAARVRVLAPASRPLGPSGPGRRPARSHLLLVAGPTPGAESPCAQAHPGHSRPGFQQECGFSPQSTVCEKIMELLGQNEVDHRQRKLVILSQDRFYKVLTAEQKAKALKGQYNFDHPGTSREPVGTRVGCLGVGLGRDAQEGVQGWGQPGRAGSCRTLVGVSQEAMGEGPSGPLARVLASAPLLVWPCCWRGLYTPLPMSPFSSPPSLGKVLSETSGGKQLGNIEPVALELCVLVWKVLIIPTRFHSGCLSFPSQGGRPGEQPSNSD